MADNKTPWQTAGGWFNEQPQQPKTEEEFLKHAVEQWGIPASVVKGVAGGMYKTYLAAAIAGIKSAQTPISIESLFSVPKDGPEKKYVGGIDPGGSKPDYTSVAFGAPSEGQLVNLNALYANKKYGEVQVIFQGCVLPMDMNFYSAERPKALKMTPVVRCPKCNTQADELGNSRQRFNLKGCGLGFGDVHPSYVEKAIVAYRYTLHPCGCDVSSEWAGNFTGEVAKRIGGGTPMQVKGLSKEEIDKQLEVCQEAITKLYQSLAAAKNLSEKNRISTYIVVMINRIEDLYSDLPGSTKYKPGEVTLTADVYAWASKQNLTVPPKPSVNGMSPDDYPPSVVVPDYSAAMNHMAKAAMQNAANDITKKVTAPKPLYQKIKGTYDYEAYKDMQDEDDALALAVAGVNAMKVNSAYETEKKASQTALDFMQKNPGLSAGLIKKFLFSGTPTNVEVIDRLSLIRASLSNNVLVGQIPIDYAKKFIQLAKEYEQMAGHMVETMNLDQIMNAVDLKLVGPQSVSEPKEAPSVKIDIVDQYARKPRRVVKFKKEE